MAAIGEMHADLVLAASVDAQLQKRLAVADAEHAVMGDCKASGLGVVPILLGRARRAAIRIRGDRLDLARRSFAEEGLDCAAGSDRAHLTLDQHGVNAMHTLG